MIRIICSMLLFLPTICLAESTEIPPIIGEITCDAENTRLGWRIEPLGDQNDDGYDDFLSWDFRWQAYLFLGGDTVAQMPAVTIPTVSSRVTNFGNIIGTAHDDFVIPGRYGFDQRLNLYAGGPALDPVREFWFGVDSLYGIGYSTFGTDFNGNGLPEIISWASTQDELVAYDFGVGTDSVLDFVIPSPVDEPGVQFGSGLIGGDFNGDGETDLLASMQRDPQYLKNGAIYCFWGGPGADLQPDLVIRRPGPDLFDNQDFGVVLEKLGDVNGDGYLDFYAEGGNSLDTLGFVYFGGPEMDSFPDVTLWERSFRGRAAGDLNSDGYADLVTSWNLPYNGNGHVLVYYGGPNMDSIPDIRIENSDFPGLQDQFGTDAAGIGDYNNDGIDDLAISAEAITRGAIYILSGPGPQVDVEEIPHGLLPSDVTLSPNYPNPFNPSTTIEFSLPRQGKANLRVYNVSGQVVSTLVDKELSAGSYRAVWDGRNSSGDECSSGVYFCRLKFDGQEHSQKLILVR